MTRPFEALSLAAVRPGLEVGGYRIGERVGGGGSAIVFRARSLALGRPVALKFLRPDGDLERFLREARILARLDHPGIPAIYEMGPMADAVYFAMELVEGETLAERIDGRRIGFRQAAAAIRDVARALAHAHDLGILHRDLKPENIVFDAADRPSLVDFGLATGGDRRRGPTRPGEIVGTLAYLSPEHLRGDMSSLDERSDLYALGATLYQATTETLPYPAATLTDLLELFRLGHRPDPRKVKPRMPADLARVVRRAISIDPDDRYRSAAALAEALDETLVDRPAGRGRSKLPAAAAAGVVLVGAGLAVALAFGGRGERPVEAGPGPEPGPVVEALDASALVARSIERRDAGDLDGALADAEAALADDPGASRAYRQRALVRLDRGQADLAWADLNRAIDLAPGLAPNYVDRAAAWMMKGNVEAARDDLDQAISLDPKDASTWASRARLRFRAGDHSGAADDAEKALALDPDTAWALVVSAQLLADAGRIEEALARLDRAIARAPGIVAARRYRASVLVALGRHEAALADLDLVLAAVPDDVGVRIERAIARTQCGRTEDAIGDARRILELDPDQWLAWFLLGQNEQAAGRDEAAGAALREAHRLAPADQRPMIERAIADAGGGSR